MNLLSNSLKFTKEAGRISIICQLVKAQSKKKKAKRKFVDVY